jgi:mycothiol synthase
MASSLTFRPMVPADRPGVEALLAAIAAHDGHPGLSEHKYLHLVGDEEARVVVAQREDGDLAGYGQAAWHHPGRVGGSGHWAIEMAVRPSARSDDVIDRLFAATVARVEGEGRITAWASDPFTDAALTRQGWVATRALHEMRRPLPLHHEAPLPPGIHLDPFRPGVDEAAWLAANNAAFEGHPENGALTVQDLERKLAQPWFDPEGLLMARDGGHLVGSCWTKLHPDGTGEIYTIGVRPEARGRGLGVALVVAGLDDLHYRQGASTAMLYVDAANAEGLGLYRGLGFRTRRINREYEAG